MGVRRLSKKWMLLTAMLAAGLLAVACGSDEEPATSGGEATQNESAAVNPKDPGTACPTAAADGPTVTATPGVAIDAEKPYEALIKTEKGDIRAELFAGDAPVTVNNFVHLARCGYYDGVTFHRVIEDFMVQTGDPTGTGSGSPGYTIPDEISDRKHDTPGTLSMANAGPNTGGSQFFITHVPTPWLDGAHAIFGRVIEGQDVVNSISIRDPQKATTPGDRIETIQIIER